MATDVGIPDDEDIPTTPTCSDTCTTSSDIPTTSSVIHTTGPITRARAKLLNQQVVLFLNKFPINDNENWLLPHARTLCILRFDRKVAWETQRKKEAYDQVYDQVHDQVEHCEGLGGKAIEETRGRSREVTFSCLYQNYDQSQKIYDQSNNQVYDQSYDQVHDQIAYDQVYSREI